VEVCDLLIIEELYMQEGYEIENTKDMVGREIHLSYMMRSELYWEVYMI
jgi:hypothetical protein